MKVPTSKVDNYGTGSIHQNKYILCCTVLFSCFLFPNFDIVDGIVPKKFSKKNQAIWAKNEPQKMSSLTAGGTCSCIIVECTKNTLHNVIQLYKFNWKGVQASVINKPA